MEIPEISLEVMALGSPFQFVLRAGGLLINFIFLSIAYCYDRSRAEKEMKKDQYHSEIIDAINKRNWPASVEYSKDESVENIKGPWGEA